MTVREARKTIKQMDPKLPDDSDDYRVAMLLLLGLSTKDQRKLRSLTGYPTKFIAETVANLRKNSIWEGRYTKHSGWDDPKGGGIAFWLDVACARGWLART